MNRRVEGRDEAILDPELPIIDAHHHLFDRPTGRYLVQEYMEDAGSGHNITASVYVETMAFVRQDGPEVLRPLGEIEFANGMGAMAASGSYGQCRACAAIVGFADLRLGDAVAALLDHALEVAPERFRGMRQVSIEHDDEAPFQYMTHRPPSGVMQSPGFDQGFRHFAPRGLLFEAAVFHHQLPVIAALAERFPNTQIVLNHLGLAVGMGAYAGRRGEVFRQWSESLKDLGQRANVACKIGGLGLPFWGFGFESRPDPLGYEELARAWEPYIEVAIEAFGPERCMMESNYPPDGRSAGFVPLWNALKHATRAYSSSERLSLFHDSAARIYNLPAVAHS